MATYEQRGVSPHKPDVKKAIEDLDPGLFPGAFCKATPDVLTGSPEHCLLLHADGAGTKSAVAYIHYRRHGDASVFEGIAQDSLVMNLDDLLCVGTTGPYVLSNTIGRNARLIPGEAVRAIIHGYENLVGRLREYGVEITSCGGETADLGDVVRTLVVDSTLAVRMRRDEVIDCSNVRPGHVIVGLASFGRAVYEDYENSGIGTNGLTAARHELLTSRYREEFTETYAPEISEVAYTGRFDIDDPLSETSMTVGEALLSPTRTYAPVMVPVLARYRGQISAIFHNTGGGQTKCLNFGGNVRYEKDDLFPMPPIFSFIQRECGLSLHEMARVFNLGHRLEIVCDPAVSSEIIDIARGFGVEAKIVGRVRESSAGRSLALTVGGETLEFHTE